MFHIGLIDSGSQAQNNAENPGMSNYESIIAAKLYKDNGSFGDWLFKLC